MKCCRLLLIAGISKREKTSKLNKTKQKKSITKSDLDQPKLAKMKCLFANVHNRLEIKVQSHPFFITLKNKDIITATVFELCVLFKQHLQTIAIIIAQAKVQFYRCT